MRCHLMQSWCLINDSGDFGVAPDMLTFSKATHYIAQYQSVTDKTTFRAEIFYKKYKGLIKTDMINPNQQVAVNNNGYGDAKGF